ncbi:helix-turn-helix domain-containing protein [Paenibacillus agricola]|uniref:Helix-turn-helix transcriptional regulator n=1 Tax=Paenibacillus agricola TaxID=2716264 RepID=A0ABX0JE36_9BACL|nr:helix-turn-helix domain-containing protein [Paenibacillus agricola]NHN34790.1 helix-turn-helix transcriptional regulator [Paenibacillus agricola]
MGIWKHLYNLKKENLFLWYFVSYTLMLVIPIGIISVIVYGSLLRTLEEETVKSNITVINQARNTIDMNLRELDQFAFEISNNPNVYDFVSSKETDVVEANIKMKNIIKDINISGVNVSKNFGEAIGIYSIKNDIIISNTTKYEPDSFYKTFANNESIPYLTWISQVKSATSRQFWPAVTTMSKNKSDQRSITYLQPLTQFGISNNAVLITIMAEDKIWNFFGKGDMDTKSYRAILDKDNQLITSAPGSIDSIPVDYSTLFQNGRDHLFFNHDGKKYIAIYSFSLVIGWKYVTILPVTVFMEKISYMYLLFSVVLLICILLGLALSYIFSVQNYKPVISALQWIRVNQKEEIVSQKGEYETIMSTIKEMFTENHLLENQLHKQLPILKVHFLLRLLKNDTIDATEVNELLEFHSMRFPYGFYMVAVVNIDDYSRFLQKEVGAGKSLVRFVISNICEEVIRTKGHGFAFEIEGDKVALLINTDAPLEVEGEDTPGGILRQIKDYLNTKFKIEVSIGVGSGYSSLEMIHQSYNEAITALNYGLIRARNVIINFEHTKEYANNIHYPLEKENQLINYVKMGDFPSVESSLDKIYEINFIHRKLSPGMIYCLLNNMVSTSFKILEEIQLDYRDIFDEETDVFQGISNSKDVESIFVKIKGIFNRLCVLINDKKAFSNVYLRDGIIQYICGLYADKDLSLVKVANHFNLSPPYISTFFKQQTGYNFSDYLNRFRVQRAKDLLAEEGLSIQEIADQIGYNSANTFIRIFKKYESVTPGQYKESRRAGAVPVL